MDESMVGDKRFEPVNSTGVKGTKRGEIGENEGFFQKSVEIQPFGISNFSIFLSIFLYS